MWAPTNTHHTHFIIMDKYTHHSNAHTHIQMVVNISKGMKKRTIIHGWWKHGFSVAFMESKTEVSLKQMPHDPEIRLLAI